jgi:hypothetical protein
MSAKGLGQPTPKAIPWQPTRTFSCTGTFHIPGVCNFQGSPVQPQLYSQSFTHHPLKNVPQRFWPCHRPAGLPWNLGGSIHNPSSLAFFIPSTTAPCGWHKGHPSSSSSQALLDYGCSGLWVSRWLDIRNTSLGIPGQTGCTRTLTSQREAFQRSFYFYTFEPGISEVWPILRCPQGIFLIISMQTTVASF